MRLSFKCLVILQICVLFSTVSADDVKTTDVYARIKTGIDAVSAINTHDHLMPFEKIGNRDKTDRGEGMTLRSIWAGSYFPWIHSLEPWPKDGSFDKWWSKAQHNFTNARATSFYRYLLPAFQDLYGVDFDTITPKQARKLNDRIFENYKNDKWLREVITERANVELVFVDKFWGRLEFSIDYPFQVLVCNVTSLVRGFHPTEYKNPLEDPYEIAREHEALDGLVAEIPTRGEADHLGELVVEFGELAAVDTRCHVPGQAEFGVDLADTEREAIPGQTQPLQVVPGELRAAEPGLGRGLRARRARRRG